MKSSSIKEIAKRLAVVLLFVLLGFCMPGDAASKDAAVTGRSGS